MSKRDREPFWQRWLVAFGGALVLILLMAVWIGPALYLIGHGLGSGNHVWTALGAIWFVGGIATLFALEEWR